MERHAYCEQQLIPPAKFPPYFDLWLDMYHHGHLNGRDRLPILQLTQRRSRRYYLDVHHYLDLSDSGDRLDGRDVFYGTDERWTVPLGEMRMIMALHGSS